MLTDYVIMKKEPIKLNLISISKKNEDKLDELFNLFGNITLTN